MKKFKTTWILAAIVIALGAYAYFGEYKREIDEHEAKEKSTLVLEFQKDVVESFVIQHLDDNLTIERDGNNWKMIRPVSDQADKEAVESFLDGLFQEKTNETAREGEGINWADYGLEKPLGSVTLVNKAGQKTILEISQKKNFEGNNFLRKNTDAKVLVVSSSWIDRVTRKPSSFRDRRIYRGSMAKIDSMEIKAKAGSVRIVKKDGVWVDTSSNNYELDQSRIREIITAINETRAEDFIMARGPSVNERKTYFLTKPTLEIRLKSGGVGWYVEFGEGPNKEVYAITSNPLYLLKLPAGSIDKFKEVDLMDVRERKNAFTFPIDDIVSFRWSNELKTTELKKEHDQWSVTNDPSITVDSAKLLELIGQLKAGGVFSYLTPNDQRKFKSTHSIEVLDSKEQVIFKIEWSPPIAVKLGNKETHLVLVRTNRIPEVFAMEETWMSSLDATSVLKLGEPEVLQNKATATPVEVSK